MKFDTIRLIYLHPSRTGGSQIENILCSNTGVTKGNVRHPDIELMFGYHSNEYGYLQHLTRNQICMLSKRDLATFTVLCSIRNPISKFVSAYFYNSCEKRYSCPLEFLEKLSEKPIQHFLPQTQYTHQHGKVIYDHLIRQENYQEDLERFCNTFNFTYALQERYNRCNKSAYDRYRSMNEIDLFHAFFSREARRIFYKMYSADFHLLYDDYVEIVENML